MKKFVAYYRVSTKKQGDSGLGLDAQQHVVGAFSISAGGTIVGQYEEIETGKRSDRPKLMEALTHAKLAGATLVVAKLDRLSRNVAFLSALMESGVEFVCCDNPHATRVLIHVMVAFAEEEARLISARTKAALAVAKRNGVKLGCHNPAINSALEGKRGWAKAGVKGREIRARLQQERYGQLLPIIVALQERSATLTEIAAHLNSKGYTTSRGKKFTATQVMRVVNRQTELAA